MRRKPESTRYRRLSHTARQLKKQFETIFSAANIGIDIIDSTYRIRYIDPAWRKTCHKYSGSQLIPRLQHRVDEALKSKQIVVTEEVLEHRNNNVLQVITVPFQSERGTWMVAEINIDITEQKRTKDELWKSLSTLRATLESTADGILVVDCKGQIVDFNEQFSKMWNMPKAILESRDDRKALDCAVGQLKYPEEFIRRVKELYAEPEAESFDVLEFKNGRIFERYSRPQRIQDRIVGRVWSFRDVTVRRHAENAFRESEERYKRLLASVTDYIYTVILVNGKPTKTTHGPGCEAVTGYTPDDYERNPNLWFEMIYEEDREAVTKQTALALEGRTDRPLEHRIVHKDGSVRWIRNSAVVHHDAEGNLISCEGLITDITAQKSVEVALRESEAKYRALAETSNDFIFCVDDSGTIQYVNEVSGKIFNQKPSDLIGKKITNFFPKENSAHQLANIRRVFETGKPVEVESVTAFPGGSMWLDTWLAPLRDEKGKIKAVFGVSRNVTDRKKTEEALERIKNELENQVFIRTAELRKANVDLQASQKRQRALLDSISDLAWLKDASGCFIAVNQMFADQCGKLPDDIVGKTDFDVWPEELASRYVADDQAVMKSRKVKRVEEPLSNSMGRRIWIETVKRPILNDSGEVIGTVGSARDITERKEADTILRKSHAELEALVQERTHDLEALNEGLKKEVEAHQRAREEREKLMKELERKNKELESIIYVTSHDLRSPLVNIQGFSKILEKNYHDLTQELKQIVPDDALHRDEIAAQSSKLSRAVHFINSSVHKMDNLIDGLLRVSRIGLAPVHAERIDMNALFKTIVESMTFQINQAQATIEIAPDLPPCIADPTHAIQVFSNLMDNALKYRESNRFLKIEVRSRIEMDYVIYSVKDNGIGIANEHQDKIWELFHRLNPKGPISGEGLGLTMVRRMVDRNNGWAWVDSEPGSGSTFYVALPLPADKT